MARIGKQLIAIAVVTLAIGLGIGSVSFPTSTTVTRTLTTTPTGASRLFEVEFIQQGVCSDPEVWLAPWAVSLNNVTIVRPSNATLPLSESSFGAGPSGENYSTISFSVPNGTYNYTVYPRSFLGETGIVTVDGSDVLITVNGAPVSCTTRTSPTGDIETVPVTITNSAFEPSQVALTIGRNNTVTFFDQATQPGLVKLISESPWPTGFTAIDRGLTYGQNTTVMLNLPGVYYFVDGESENQGNVTIDVVG